MYYLAMQNTITKKISVYKLEDFGSNSVYHKFKIQTDEPNGEYIYMLLEGDTPIVTEQSFITEYVKDSCVLSTGNLKIIYNGN